jgi:mannose-6-phosphate isomerase-like protein (cupin superfamily)
VSPIKLSLSDATRKLADAEDNFVTVMTGKSGRLLLFAPDGEDHQTPHTQGEFYIIVSGNGSFRRGDKRVSFVTGDVLFAPAQVPHRFEDFSDDFQTWVIFFGPRVEPTS